MMRWRTAAWDWAGVYFLLTEDPGAIAGRFRCELKIDSVPAGWTYQSIAWHGTEDDLWNAMIEAWLEEIPFLGPIVGALVHQGSGNTNPSYAWAYDGGAVYTANCTVTFLKPDETQWVTQVSASADELVLTAGGPLLIGIHATEPHKPYWDDGYKDTDEIPGSEGQYRSQLTPWYLDVFDQEIFVSRGEFGQPIQRGLATLRLSQPENGALTSIVWSVSGSAAISAPWTGAIQQVAATGVCPEIRIQATNDTANGAIIPRAKYVGLYKQTAISEGESFTFFDHSDECPPPGYFSTTVDEEEADYMNYYKFTGHKPQTCDPVGPVEDNESLVIEVGQTTYNIHRHYVLEVKDASGRPMRGAWVQERFRALTCGTVWQVGAGFTVNTSDVYWTTVRLNPAGGYFSYDVIGVSGVINNVFPNGGIVYSGTHEYWVGSRWAPSVQYNGVNQFTITEQNKPNSGYGLGVKTGTYVMTIRTNSITHSKQ
ncbi:MAG: hypothetical protein IT363_11615 [Methanoregulaceae archaeon]|nr:hypothetical protein [Methanoregulaceae archaeon]